MSTIEAERFAEALRPGVMGPRLAAAMGGGGPTSCRILDAKFEQGVRATVLYELAGQLLRGDLEPDTEGAGPLSVVPPGVRVSAFPHDPDLPALACMTDPASLGRVLADALQGRPDLIDERRIRHCRITLLRYRPGKRATVLVRTGPAMPALVAKAYHDPAKAAAVAGEASRLAEATGSSEALRLAATVGHLPELGVVVQRAVDGTPLDVLLSNTRLCVAEAWDGVRLAARALAELHRSSVVTTRQRPVERELQRFGVRAGRVSTVDPAVGGALAELAQRLVHVHADLPPMRTGLVHGDCKPSQFLLAGPHAYLLDMDHCGVSDQAVDAGTFLATLRQLRTRHALARRSSRLGKELTELADQFLEVYLANVDRRKIGRYDVDEELRTRIRWQEAVALERKALRAFARAPRSPLAAALVKEGHRCLDRLTPAA